MCGIAGIYNYSAKSPVTRLILEKMLACINHRGPDERGIYLGHNIGLGNVRLSIIDLATGQQPQCDSSGNYWIVFNGEIFNYIEIRKDLESFGYQFKTKSDTEVLVAAYATWGKSFLPRLNGQFAFAIWDKRREELFLARDRVGICPLYYTNVNGSFVWGSEIKAILQWPGVKPELNINSLIQLFTYWAPTSPNTIFKNIFEITPGHYMLVNASKIQTDAYWKLNFDHASTTLRFSEAKDELSEILTDAVRIRLRADVPVAAYLSGGLDSTSTTALIKSIEPDILNTFSIGFADNTFDETQYQQEASRFLHTNHLSLRCTNADVSAAFQNVIWHAESPMMRTAPAPMYKLSNFVRNNQIKVVITGEGADEMLGGYDIFKEMIIRRFWAREPKSSLRPLLLKKLYPYIPQISQANVQMLKFFYGFKLEDTHLPYYSHLMRWNNGRHILNFLHPAYAEDINNFDPCQGWLERLPEGFDAWSDLAKAQYLEITQFMSGYLLTSQGDRMTMANSVEGRYPFLDHRLIEFSAKLPDSFKVRGLNEKYILKKCMEKRIPESIYKRSKQAYRAPISNSFFDDKEQDYVQSVLSSKLIDEYGIFNSSLTSRLVEKIKKTGSASEVENMALTAIISTQLFNEYFILGKTPEIASPKSQLRLIEES
jgi:asparagine synthase (glutamine-hydrolysing)